VAADIANRLSDFLSAGRVLLADGAMGTRLSELGLPPGQAPESWNLLNPAAIGQVHRDYLAAGVRVLLTNTFGANPFKLERYGLSDRLEEVNRRGVELARAAAGSRPILVAGDLGPSGELLEPLGRLSAAALKAGYRRQVQGLESAGVDFFLIETMTSLDEARAISDAVAEVSARPLAVSFTFSVGRQGPRTLMGESPLQAAKAFGGRAWLLGANCGEGPAETVQVLQELRAARPGQLLWAKPNAGRPVLRDGRSVFLQGPEDFGREALRLAQAGAAVVGGCCGTTPAHLAAAARRLAHLNLLAK